MISNETLNITKVGRTLYKAWFVSEGQEYVYRMGVDPEEIATAARAQGFTDIVLPGQHRTPAVNTKKIKIIKRGTDKPVPLYKPKPRIEYKQMGKWKTNEDSNNIYSVGQYQGLVYEVGGEWFVCLIGTGVALAEFGKDGTRITVGMNPDERIGWDRMAEAMAWTVGFVDTMHKNYEPQPMNDFKVGDTVQASKHNWNHEQGTWLTIEDVSKRSDVFAGAASHPTYYAEGAWHRNMDVEEFGSH